MFAILAVRRVAVAQIGRLPRLAIVATTPPESDISATGSRYFRALFSELRRLGHDEGRTLIVDRWSARSESQRFPTLARDVVITKPDVILASGGTDLARALQAETTTIPIVVSAVGLVEAGLADSLARPGRNVTGVGAVFGDIGVKGLELLREAIPTATRIAYLGTRIEWDNVAARPYREAAPRLGITLIPMLLDDPLQPSAYRRVFAAMPDQRIDAVMFVGLLQNLAHRQLVVELAAASRLPTIASLRDVTEAGGLMSYGNDLGDWARVVGGYVVRVLQGEKPANMPIRLLDRLELVVNLKTARTLGLTIPPAILARADEVIE